MIFSTQTCTIKNFNVCLFYCKTCLIKDIKRNFAKSKRKLSRAADKPAWRHQLASMARTFSVDPARNRCPHLSSVNLNLSSTEALFQKTWSLISVSTNEAFGLRWTTQEQPLNRRPAHKPHLIDFTERRKCENKKMDKQNLKWTAKKDEQQQHTIVPYSV